MGDDLGDDFDLSPILADGGDNDGSAVVNNKKKSKRRVDDDDNIKKSDDVDSSKKKTKLSDGNDVTEKKKLPSSSLQVMLQSGRNIEVQSTQHQATFLTTCMKHYYTMSKSKDSSNDDDDDDVSTIQVHPYQCLTSILLKTDPTGTKVSFVEYIKQHISNKQLKQWSSATSPAIVIVCISARRAVTVLKQIQSLRIQCAKLFPKNGSIPEQIAQFMNVVPPIVVGTPNRIYSILQQTSKDIIFSLQHTRLVILDSSMNSKEYTVSTLPDTAPDCMMLLKQYVVPHLVSSTTTDTEVLSKKQLKKLQKQQRKGKGNVTASLSSCQIGFY